jgi:ABC-type Fe3+ transport system substrate-binding protein
MLSPSIQRLNQQLVEQWLQSGIGLGSVTPHHYLSAIMGLAFIIDNPDQTRRIVETLLTEAMQQGYSSDWIITEIQFEAQAHTAGNRTKWIQHLLATGQVDDAAFDTYNERLKRFSVM